MIAQLEGPSWSFSQGHFLGADSLGRDLLSRLFHGARIALTVAVGAAVPTMIIGTILGLLAGYLGGVTDAVISRLIDVWTSFPPVLLSIILVALIGTGLFSVIFAIIVIDWTRFARVVRAETLKQRHMDYVDAATVSGLKPLAILFREILPNVLPLVLVLFTLEMGIAVIVEADPLLRRLVALERRADLGRHDRGRPPGHQPGALHPDAADAGDPRHRSRPQPLRRRPQGRARSGAAMSEPLLTIKHLSAVTAGSGAEADPA